MLFALLSLLVLGSVEAYPAGAKITSLPGYSGPQLSMYSGYVSTGGTRQYFYWFIEAQNKDPNAPLIFWYQGGPGCSGLAGLLNEHGPLVPNKAGGVSYNPVSWTNFASVVYLEQPAFVGYSYSDDPLDHYCDDEKAARLNEVFVNNWLQLYPSYKGRQTYVAGESYGGMYVPSLTARLLSNPNSQIYKQLAGLAVGNPVFNCGSSTVANQMGMYYYNGLVSYSDMGPFLANNCMMTSSETCDSIFQDAQNKIGVIDQELRLKSRTQTRTETEPNLDPDCLYQDFCTGNATLDAVSDIPNNCSPLGDLTTTYLRRRDVHRALHTSGPLGIFTENWSICSDKIIYTPSGSSLVPLYKNFQKQKPGFKVLVYSGTTDIATVPMAMTKPCLYQVNNNFTSLWQPYFVNGNNAGHWEQTPNYIFATVKGAGHETPQYQPLSAYHMIHRFIFNGTLTDASHAPRRRSVPMSQGDVLRRMLNRKRHSRKH